MKTEEDDSKRFWEEKEREKGGKVSFFTFATFIGTSLEKPVNTGGLLYTIEKSVYFEDFEKENWFAKILSRKQKYVKTEFNFKKEDIEEIKRVSKNTALNCISGIVMDTDTKPLSKVFTFMLQSVVQIRLKMGYSLFLEIMREGDFLAALEKL